MVEISAIDAISCEADPVVYEMTATVWSRFSAQLQWTDGDASLGSLTWTDIGEPYTNAELQAGVQFTVPAGAISVRLAAVVGDCTIGESIAEPLPCVCPEFCFPGAGGAVAGAVVVYGDCGISLAELYEPIEAEYRVDGGEWTTVPTIEVSEFVIKVYVLATAATGYTTIQFRARSLVREGCDWTESIVYS